MLIDATVNLDFEPKAEYGGERYPPTVMPHDQNWKKVNARWKEYGFED